MFWNMLGFSHLYAGSRVLSKDDFIYWLNIGGVEFPDKLKKKLDKRYLSQKSVDDLLTNHIIYHNADGSKQKIMLNEIQSFSDLSNGIGNWYGGNSALDALYKIVSNSEAALDAKNINLDFAGKYMIGGDANAENIYELPLNKQEKKSLEAVATSGKKVTAVKARINIERFVENIAQLQLDKAYFSDYYAIGKMYGIPKDVLEANMDRGATFENQEKATGKHVAYTLEPKGEDLAGGLKSYFNLDIDIVFSWDHLQFMNAFEMEKAKTAKLKAETIKILVDSGVSPESITEILGVEIKTTVK